MMNEERVMVRRVMPHDKIAGRHYERLAIVYVRQSTPQQVERHQESDWPPQRGDGSIYLARVAAPPAQGLTHNEVE